MLSALALPIVNRLLAQQPWAQTLLRPHAGKTGALRLGGIALAFEVSAEGNLSPHAGDGERDVVIDIPVAALPYASEGFEELSARAKVSGDAGFAEVLARLLRELRPDIGAAASPFVGDILANRIERGVHSAGQFLQRAMAGARDNTVEFLRDESAMTVSRPELEAMSREIAALRDDLSRLDKRIARL